MIVAHKIALDPNHVQATYFRRAAGVARFAYNLGLARWRQQYAAWQADPTVPKPSEAALRRQLNAIKADEFPWMLDVTKNALQMALIHLGHAFKNFFTGTAKLATISRTADRWFVSITVEMPDPAAIRPENQRVVGVDLGISALATLSTGEKIVGPKAYAAALQKLRRLSQQFSRQMEAAKVRAGLKPGDPIPKGMHLPLSKNMRTTQRRIARLHARIANIRADALHQLPIWSSALMSSPLRI